MKINRLWFLATLATTVPLLISPVARADDHSTDARVVDIKARVESIKIKSKERIAELKTKVSEKTTGVRTKACESRKNNIEIRLKNRVEAAKRHQEKFSNIYEKIKLYAEEKSFANDVITSAGNKVIAEKSQVSSEIETLEAIDVNIDCQAPESVAVTIDAYKNQLDSVKVSLKDYRESIRIYSQAVKRLAEEGEGI